MYLTYEEYINYGGALSETTFTEYYWEAKALIDWYTFNRLETWFIDVEYPEALKRCVYKLIQMAELKANALIAGSSLSVDGATSSDGGAIIHQSNDGVSITYNAMGASDLYKTLNPFVEDSEVAQTIRLYLTGIKDELGRSLLYRGLYPGE